MKAKQGNIKWNTVPGIFIEFLPNSDRYSIMNLIILKAAETTE